MKYYLTLFSACVLFFFNACKKDMDENIQIQEPLAIEAKKVKSYTHSFGQKLEFSYDQFGRLSTLVKKAGSGNFNRFHFIYNNDELINRIEQELVTYSGNTISYWTFSVLFNEDEVTIHEEGSNNYQDGIYLLNEDSTIMKKTAPYQKSFNFSDGNLITTYSSPYNYSERRHINKLNFFRFDKMVMPVLDFILGSTNGMDMILYSKNRVVYFGDQDVKCDIGYGYFLDEIHPTDMRVYEVYEGDTFVVQVATIEYY